MGKRPIAAANPPESFQTSGYQCGWPTILNVVEAFMAEHGELSPESALGRLISRSLLKVETDNPFIRSLEKISFVFSAREWKGKPIRKARGGSEDS